MKVHRTARRTVNKKRLTMAISIVTVCVVAIACALYFAGCAKEEEAPEPIVVQNFAQGVSVGGVDLSGMTVEQGREALQPLVQEMTQGKTVEFTLPEGLNENTPEESAEPIGEDGGEAEETPEAQPTSSEVQTPEVYKFTLEQMGVMVDIDAPLQQALAYSQQEAERIAALQAEQDDEENAQPLMPAVRDFPIERRWDAQVVQSQVLAMQEMYGWGEEPQGASYTVRTTSDEDSGSTWGEMVKTDPVDGWEVDTDALAATLVSQIEADTYSPFIAEVKTIRADEALEQVPEIRKMGSFTTNFSGSSEGRMYNIWKISDKLNGAVFKPGEEFSVNDHVGDRNEENGWAIAMGIENGVYTPQYGGGICQVSSTMYNACLYAELTPTARRPHTIMAKYTPPGRDATISTGGPDFKLINEYPRNMYMIVKCDVPSREVTVEIYGTVERDYEVQIESKLVSTQPIPSYEYVTDGSLEPFAVSAVHKGQEGEYYEIYISHVYADGRSEVVKTYTSTYPAKGATYAVGSGVPLPANGTPLGDVQAQADQLKGAQAAADQAAAEQAAAEQAAAEQAAAEQAEKEAREKAEKEAKEQEEANKPQPEESD